MALEDPPPLNQLPGRWLPR